MVADAKRFTGGVSGNKMRQVICCDEGREDMRSEVRRGAELTGSETSCRQRCACGLTGSSLALGRAAC